jgi:two-component system chemotaxis sensor kinase CheA
MTPMLQQFLSESREFLQRISQRLLSLEHTPEDAALLDDLFRSVHTLKGNSGLFDFPEMTRVLHAAEDLMSAVREKRLSYSRSLADQLLDAMDFISLLADEIESTGESHARHAARSTTLAQQLRQFIPGDEGAAREEPRAAPTQTSAGGSEAVLASIPGELRAAWAAAIGGGQPHCLLVYTPEPECFFKGEDPLYQVIQTPNLVWQHSSAVESWPSLAELDPYRCNLRFTVVTTAAREAIEAHFRYVPDQIALTALTVDQLLPRAPAQAAAPKAPDAGRARVENLMRTQIGIFALRDDVACLPGRLKAAVGALRGCLRSTLREALIPELEAALARSLEQRSAAPLRGWAEALEASPGPAAPDAPDPGISESAPIAGSAGSSLGAETVKTLKVDQEKIDRLMNLIGEMVVAKNGLPFLAGRAENHFGVRELAREIKAQYAVINRIASEMQDAIMQVRMMPVSFIFQRFPRLVRDITRKLGKEVDLVLEGEATEADKNIIEALADPLIHIVRNSLDHGIESPEVRRAAGKPPAGRLVIRATQESDRVYIDIIDDGKGIDPAVVKRKAYEKGLIDEATLERISDKEAIQLIFAAGFSTADVVSDLSGRGVGMDVVRSAVNQVNGTVTLESTPGRGTRLRLSLPLSMAVTNVMVIESDHRIFGVPMDMVLETVRLPRSSIRAIKNRQTTILRDRIMPVRSLNELLASTTPQQSNEEDELATLIVQIQGEPVGILVDDFREVIDIILKPMSGILSSLSGYSGSALLGDGSVLMVLNPKELVTWQ